MRIEFESVKDLAANLVKKGHSEEDAERIAKSMFGESGERNTEKNEEDNSMPSFEEFTKSLDAAVKDERITSSDALRAESAFRVKDKKLLDEILDKMKPKSE